MGKRTSQATQSIVPVIDPSQTFDSGDVGGGGGPRRPRCAGTGHHHRSDGDHVTKRKPLPEERKAGGSTPSGLQAHPEAEDQYRVAAESRELEGASDRRGWQGGKRA